MSWLHFDDGESFDTSGSLRKEQRHDGWYIVGNGTLIPMKDELDCDRYIKRHTTQDEDFHGPNKSMGV
tara:strand:- start:1057 stop:1260 length:204 start_codon:yes stop_codon:yes gene_type:complete